ncbi:MAG: hypothetical protein IJ593_11425 [Lachnospiraceae bacterium]|nr:hypothetical protein [Lachnospiraceae bacterium]
MANTIKNRTRDYYRKQRARHINRKKKIIKNQGNYWHFEHPGVLSKGKIHCSCWMCRHKSYDYTKMQDLRRNMSAVNELVDEGYGRELINHIINRTNGSELKNAVRSIRDSAVEDLDSYLILDEYDDIID